MASKDELFGQFFAALDKIRYFRMMPDGSDDVVGVEKATRLFHDALTVSLSFSLMRICIYHFYVYEK